MKKIYSILAVALLTTGALLTTACSGDDDAVVDNITPQTGTETIQFTATLAPKDGATTRAITTGTDASNNEILNVAWTAGEEVAVYYQKSDDTYATATATVDEVDATTGVATINATLDSPKNGGTVKFVYPASLHNGAGDIDENILLNDQRGFLTYSGSGTDRNSISKFFDAATGSGIISTAAGTAVVSGKVKLTNRVCICKISFSFKNGNTLTPITRLDKVEIMIGDKTYSILPSALKSTHPYIYVAMLPCEGAEAKFLAYYGEEIDPATNVTTYTETYVQLSSNVSLAAGKFYRSISLAMGRQVTVTLTPETGAVTLDYGATLTGTGGDVTHVTIADGATVWLSGVNIPGRDATDNDTPWAGITCAGNATIILAGTNYVKGYNPPYPGIQAGPTETTLILRGAGQLQAHTGMGTTDGYGAGIGGGRDMAVGNIRIEGGSIIAAGDNGGAGIGSGLAEYGNSSCGNITITGGTVSATGGSGAAGIGSGNLGVVSNSCGNITIGSGVTGITATQGHNAQAPIGKGNSESTCGTITIDDTTAWTAGTATEHFNWAVSTVQDTWGRDVTRWTLTHK